MTPHAPALPGLLSLAGPLYAELLLGLGMGLVGTWLASRLGDAHGAAFAICSQVLAMLFVLFRIVGAGVGVVVSQALGGQRRDEADRIARATVGASTWIGGGCMLAAMLAAEPLLRLLNTPAEVLPLALPLLRWMAPTVLLDAWVTTLGSVLRAHLYARPTLMVNGSIQVLHLVLAVLLMQGVGGWQGLGLPGFPVALLLARAVGMALFLLNWRSRLGLVTPWRDFWVLRRRLLAPVLRVGLPGAAENMAWRFGFVVSLSVVGSMGTQAVATHAYTMQIVHLILVFSVAVGLSGEIMVGHLVGAGQLHRAHRLVQRMLLRGILGAGAIATGVACIGGWLISGFTRDPAIIAAGGLLLWLTVALEMGRAFNVIVANALRAAGDATYPLVAGLPFFLLVLAGGSWLLGAALGWGLVGVWLAYITDEWLRGLIMWRRWASLAWVPMARRAHRRLKRVAV